MISKTKTILILLGSLILPFIGYVFLLHSPLGHVFNFNHLGHSLLVSLVCLLAFLISFFLYYSCHESHCIRTLAVSLAFFTFGFVFFLHTIPILGLSSFGGLVFDITENQGIFLGLSLMLMFFLPILEKKKKWIYRHKKSIFTLWIFVLLLLLSSMIIFPAIAYVLESVMNVFVGLTAVLLIVTVSLLFIAYQRTKIHIFLYLTSGFAFLVSNNIIPFFSSEADFQWWYFHFMSVIGFAIILIGLRRAKRDKYALDEVFEKIPFYSKISTKLSFFVILTAFVPLLAVSYYSFGVYRANLESQISEDIIILAESKKGHAYSYIEAITDRTIFFSSDGFIVTSVKQINKILSEGETESGMLSTVVDNLNNHLIFNKKPLDENIAGILILNAEGTVIASTDNSHIGNSEVNSVFFKEGLTKPSLSEQKDSITFGGRDLIVVGIPIKDPYTDSLIGVIVNFFNSSELAVIFSELSTGYDYSKIYEKGIEAYIVDNDRNLIAGHISTQNSVPSEFLVDTLPVRKCLDSREEIIDVYKNYKGADVIGVSKCLNIFGWTLLIEVDKGAAMSSLVKLQRVLAIVTLFIVIVIVFIAIYFSHLLTDPLEALIGVSKKISSGDLHARAKSGYSNEIGILAKSLNQMAEELLKRNDEHEHQEREMLERATKLTQLNLSLENTKRATLNVLEDLDEEKRKIEERIIERTKELEEEKTKLSHVTENMHTGTIFIDENNKVSFINNSAQKLLNTKTDDTNEILTAFEKKFPNIKYNDYLKICADGGDVAVLPEVTSGKSIYEIEFKCLNNTGEKVLESIGHYGTFIWIRDITEQKLLERSKSELVAVASHQLRTPLTIARGNLEMMLDGSFGEANEKQLELLHDTEDSVIRLIELVNDMLDITKIEKGDIDLVLSKFSILEPLDIVMNNLGDYAKRHGFNISIHKPDNNLEVFADSSRLVQVFQNLIDNAIRYGRAPGKVDVAFSVKDGMAVVSVGDNGIGIPETEQANLFGRFYRASNAVKFASSGSGLGLFIVKSLVEQMGGTVWFESVENVGTKFFFTVPLKDNNQS